jgi:hypothetical protein
MGPVYNCEFCGVSLYGRRDNLTRHEETAHGINLKKLKCEQCDFATIRSDTLLKHRRYKHAGNMVASACSLTDNFIDRSKKAVKDLVAMYKIKTAFENIGACASVGEAEAEQDKSAKILVTHGEPSSSKKDNANTHDSVENMSFFASALSLYGKNVKTLRKPRKNKVQKVATDAARDTCKRDRSGRRCEAG